MLLRRRLAFSRVLAVVIVVVLVVLAGVGFLLYENAANTADQVKFSLGFPASYFDAPHYYGLDQGYYRSNGINVTILPGTGGAAAITSVSTGQVDFALTDASGLVYSLVNSNVTNVRIVAVMFPKSFFGIIYNKAKISTLSDIQGKTGAAGNPTTTIATKLFLALLKLNNLNISTMTMNYGSQTVVEEYVATGKSDFAIGGAQDIAGLQAAASKNGIQLGFFPYSQYGIDSYGEVLITSTSMIQSHSDLVRRFVLATLQSLTAATLNPAAAVASMEKYQPQLNQTLMLQGFNIDVSCCLQGVSSSTDPLVFGYIDPARMQQTVNTAVQGLGVNKSVNATSFYTDAYTVPP